MRLDIYWIKRWGYDMEVKWKIRKDDYSTEMNKEYRRLIDSVEGMFNDGIAAIRVPSILVTAPVRDSYFHLTTDFGCRKYIVNLDEIHEHMKTLKGMKPKNAIFKRMERLSTMPSSDFNHPHMQVENDYLTRIFLGHR
jgi:hypothetical protein